MGIPRRRSRGFLLAGGIFAAFCIFAVATSSHTPPQTATLNDTTNRTATTAPAPEATPQVAGDSTTATEKITTKPAPKPDSKPATVTHTPVSSPVSTPAPAAKPKPAPVKPDLTPTCTNGTYVNSAGNIVCSPESAPSAPAGATAQCRDGTYSFSATHSGTCSHHGGVAVWL